MKKLIQDLINDSEFEKNPPILVDIGASGEIHPEWRELASKSICLAFDADDREFQIKEIRNDKFKKLYLFNCIISDSTHKNSTQLDFFLTKYPYCSSLLKPENEKLKSWIFANLFDVEEIKKVNTKSLENILKELNITYIDWFKTDSQGTDLRLFMSLEKEIVDKVIIAQFEPGIINAYKSEDRLYSIIEHMNSLPFWMDHMEVKGTQRLSYANAKKYTPYIKYENGDKFIKSSPCWAEVSYINSFTDNSYTKREILLGIIISLIREQFGFALDLAIKGSKQFPEFNKFHNVLNKIILFFEEKNKSINHTNQISKLNRVFTRIFTILK